MNFVNRFLAGRKIRDGVGNLGEMGALLLPASDLSTGPWVLASSSCSPIGLAGGLM